jgi:hypothetical protein
MDSIKTIFDQLDQNCDLHIVRCAIADLITHHLLRTKSSNNALALAHFTNAVGSLTLNINSSRQPTKAGLSVCLLDLEKAIEAIDHQNGAYDLRVKRAESVTYDMLIEAVCGIRAKALCQTSSNEQAAYVAQASRR